MTFKIDEIQTFLDLYAQIKTGIEGFEGCEKLELWQDTTHPNVFTTYSIWQSEMSLENIYNTLINTKC